MGGAGGVASSTSAGGMGGSGVGGAAGGMGGAGGGPLLPWTKHFGSADDDYAYGPDDGLGEKPPK
jgi:hypothetical protein